MIEELFIKCTVASIVSPKLCGGIDVAIPTAIPLDPFTNRFGYLDGNTDGSFKDSSKFGTKSTVSLSISLSNYYASLLIFASV